MFAKLIQMTRGLALDEISIADYQYQKLLYWVTFASCFGVLLFLVLVIRYSSSSKIFIKFGFLSIVMYAIVYVMLASAGHGSNYGLHLPMVLLWVLEHGVAAVKLIQHILQTFTSCASIGEALLVTAGLTTYTGDILKSTLLKITRGLISSDIINMQLSVKRSEISTIIQCYLLGLLLLPFLFKISVEIVDRLICFTLPSSRATWSCNDSYRSFIFFTSLMVGSTAIIPLWVKYVQDFQMHPLWCVDEQVTKDIQLVDAIAEWQAQIFSEECNLFPPADVQIQSIYPL